MQTSLSLVLGCGGYSYRGFSLCSGTYNVITEFSRHFEGVELEKVMDFLDYTCNLFDGVMSDWNKITNTLKMLRTQFHLIDDQKWESLHIWLPRHKQCGAVLRLVLSSEVDAIFSAESLIKPSNC